MSGECRCLASVEVVPGVIKRCVRASGHAENHLWVEAFTRLAGDPLIAEWNDRRVLRTGSVMLDG